MPRPVIKIDEEKCDGCGKCVLDCAEGALEVVNGKARLINESYCDGLGACINCPKDALILEMRDAAPFDEEAALAAKKAREQKHKKEILPMAGAGKVEQAQISNWPIQLSLLPGNASFLKNADVQLCAHCAGFALPDIQQKWMKDKAVIIACPKIQDKAMLTERLANALKDKDISSLGVLRMSVPCCSALVDIASEAMKKARISVPLEKVVVKL